MLPSTIAFNRLLPKNAFRCNQLMIRNLIILSVSSFVWNPVKASMNPNNKPVVISSASSAMNEYSTKANIPIVEYAEVKDLPNHPEKLLIDVREPRELEATGRIPTAINIPLAIVGQELALNGSVIEFQKKYGRSKPEIDTYIIMQCRSGRRSQEAAEIAVALGYTNVHNYAGSWLDWAEREGLPKEA